MSSNEVAAHYNAVPQQKIDDRVDSRIFYMRNMNNWIKSALIGDFADRLRDQGCHHPRVLDIACGKGGDLRKWHFARVKSIVFADIADVSIEQARGRYKEMNERRQCQFPAQFIVADCCKDTLADKYEDSQPFDLVSCQFALHYSFIDETSARNFLRNCTERLRPGGYLIGSLPDANRIVWSARKGGGEFKNSVCSIKFTNPAEILNGSTPPLFGSEFHFALDQQVNCPEFLCYFPLLESILQEYDMELVMRMTFPEAIDFYMKSRSDGRTLLERMKALEAYPSKEDAKLVGEEQDYAQAEKMRRQFEVESIGTLSQPEWEAVSMYIVYAFRKKGADVSSLNAQDEPSKKKLKSEEEDGTVKEPETKED